MAAPQMASLKNRSKLTRGWGFLNLLMSALKRAFAFEEVDAVAVFIEEHGLRCGEGFRCIFLNRLQNSRSYSCLDPGSWK